MKKILVTGSSGMIGTALVENLLKNGKEVICLDREENIFNEKIELLRHPCDLTCREHIDHFLENEEIDICVHLAANARVHYVINHPQLALENIVSTINILDACREKGVKKFIFASSREVYGDRDRECYEEFDVDIHHVLSNYTASKLSGEAFVRAYTNCYNMEHIILRFSNVYGRYDLNDRFVPLCIARCLMEEDVTIFDERKVMDFTYLDDTVQGVYQCLLRFQDGKNEVFNISSGHPVKLLFVAEFIREELASSNKIIKGANRVGEITHYLGDCTKAKTMLGYSPRHSIQEGLSKSVEWYLGYFSRNRDSLQDFRLKK